eukprot:CAMPEP_0182534532 /NCGR_PEP_ID=MMETSP1323-20130603/15949_1 /TAXON_ID=236787 /ORGANISM="Florenciella parvula, Strain RCC1693" /LENGTH=115 /DNA_ID=CAMNT_0024744557 /DNA_START=31 /DNA_END=381 /DNA_ORIENTATION=-
MSAQIFAALGAALPAAGAKLQQSVGGTIAFNVTGAAEPEWFLDLSKSGTPSLTKGKKKADLTVTISDKDFVKLAMGKMNPQQAFMKGVVKVKGKIALAMKLQKVFDIAKGPRSKL